MSVMSDMVFDMVKKLLPPETAEMFAPDKMRAFGNDAKAFVDDIKGSLSRIENQNLAIIDLLEKANVNGSSDKPGTGKRSASRGDASGAGNNGQ